MVAVYQRMPAIWTPTATQYRAVLTAGGRRGGVMEVQHELRGRAVSRRPLPCLDSVHVGCDFPVSRLFLSKHILRAETPRSIFTVIYLCHACSCQEILRARTAAQGFGRGARARGGRAASAQAPSYIPAHMQTAQVRPVDPLDMS
eukprot:COSAG01_NODE_1552_length_9933_cov_13.631483_4_plen_145_part_00